MDDHYKCIDYSCNKIIVIIIIVVVVVVVVIIIMTRVWIIIFTIVTRVASCDSLSLTLSSTEAKKCKHKLRRLHRKVKVIRLDGKQSKCMNFFTRPND